MWVYIVSNPFTAPLQYDTGFYIPTSGIFIKDGTYSTIAAAAARVSYLNGGTVAA